VSAPSPAPAPTPPALLVETPDDLERLASRLASEPRIALDTEANSLHAFRERVCVVQLSVPGLDAIVDPLLVPDLSPLRALVDRDGLEVVMHGGDYDVTMLTREHRFEFRRVFDTMIAATLLGDERVGLAALVEGSHGVALSKRFQTADWARRPLSPPMLEYLRNDTRFLLDLRDRLGERLAQADLVEEAEIEFRRLAALRRPPPVDDPEAWREVKGAEKLRDAGRAVLKALFAWRDERARGHDVPRFRILPNEGLVALAERPPADLEALARVPGLRAVVAEGDGDAVLATVRAGLDAAARGGAPPPSERPRRTPEERARLDRIREREERVRRWRNDEARARGVPNVVVLPNVAMRAITEAPPASVDALAALPDVGGKRAARYGETILRLLADVRPPPPTDPPR
jgi:ribonuclease D